MEQALIEQVKQLLQSTGSIIEKHEEIARLKGENFNIFRVLGIEDKEVKLHSRFIAELLNPKGSHDQGMVFLKMFLEQVVDPLLPDSFPEGCKARPDENRAEVYTEHSIGPVKIKGEEGEESKGGRIDIFITDRTRHVSIENKIKEPEQEDYQITRYCNHETDRNLVLFLTPQGDEASTKKKYHPISYKEHILPWLESCHKHCADLPILRETIKQYIITIKGLTGGLTMQKMEKTIQKLMMKNIEAAHEIYSNYDCLFKETVDGFVQKVKKEIKSKEPVFSSPEDWNIEIYDNDRGGLKIRNTKWKCIETDLRKTSNEDHCLQVGWTWEVKSTKSRPFYGIIAHKEHFERNKIKEELNGIEEELELKFYLEKDKEWTFWIYTKEADFQDPNQLKSLWNQEERSGLAVDVACKLVELMDFCDKKLLPPENSNS